MLKFIRFLFSTVWQFISWLRTAFFNLVFALILVAILASIASAPHFEMPDETALFIAPAGYLVDQRTYNPSPSELILGNSDQAEETPLFELIETINSAAKDSRITALIFQLDHFQGGGISKMEELGQALQAFKDTGKPIYAYADNYSQQQYFLASYANTVYLNDMGNVLLTGFGMYKNYYKEASDKLSIKFHVFRVGDYKDAVEPFMRNGMSDASREHNGRWISDLWQRYTHAVTGNRNLDENAIEQYIAALASQPSVRKESLSEIARLSGLVDELHSRNAIHKALAEKVGEHEEDPTFASINYQQYRQEISSETQDNSDNIGLIVATGTIYDGYHDTGSIGGDSLSDLIEQARKDDSLKALVIRVNSGGGSAFASEVIRQQIIAAKESDLPVYISMGSMAASGGYWISTAAQEIWATPSTLTGSIGVWGLIPNVNEGMERLGIYSDGVGTTDLSDVYNIDRELREPAQNLIQSGVNDVYHRFLSIVADARESDPASVNEIAGGRVWTGSSAQALGLIDHLGSLQDVFAAVASTQQLSDYDIKIIRKPLSTTEEFMRALMEGMNAKIQSLVLQGPLGNLGLLQQLSKPSTESLASGAVSLSALLRSLITTNNEGQQPKVMAHCLECYAP